MDKWDEYTFFAESTQYLSDRRQNATQTYIGVNTAIFAVIGFLVKDSGLNSSHYGIATLPLIAVGIFVCYMWYRIIVQYKELIGWGYDQLMAMENQMKECHKMYLNEWEDFFKPRKDRKNFGFSNLEKRLPIVFLGLYIIYGLVLLGIAITNIC